MLLFRQGDVVGSLREFDKAIELDPRQKAYLWQRGLSLYYLDRFEEGAEQFRIDVAQNPNDTEESIWCFLCEAQLYGVDEARKRYLEVGKDPRPVMREVYNLFKDGGDPEKLVAGFLNGRDSEYFYASLYAGLYYEAENKPEGAKRCIISACQSPYGERSDDYMASLAKLYWQMHPLREFRFQSKMFDKSLAKTRAIVLKKPHTYSVLVQAQKTRYILQIDPDPAYAAGSGLPILGEERESLK
ncbi:hypothetical protein BT93_L4005 [Corymbia citriodora subsp. variegata]|uniref:Tetratricopeptide repeat protein n=1 Tax=Corymbia citriodora subsp. variegata TaxID=360336 RepID=A0A8T0CLE7_CORYI|nr:hypothetical protein BT93_L4005 [Corymbia citriodora subsp. variegata]